MVGGSIRLLRLCPPGCAKRALPSSSSFQTTFPEKLLFAHVALFFLLCPEAGGGEKNYTRRGKQDASAAAAATDGPSFSQKVKRRWYFVLHSFLFRVKYFLYLGEYGGGGIVNIWYTSKQPIDKIVGISPPSSSSSFGRQR